MTDFARLGIEIDSRQVKDGVGELDKLTAAGQRADQATQALASAQAKAQTTVNAYKDALRGGVINQEQYNLGVLRTKQGLATLEDEYRRAQSALLSFQRSQEVATVSAGQQRAGMQQLSYQIGDVAQQFALGTNPMIIFAQQGQQVIQALTMMHGGASGLAGFMAGPWGAAIMGGVTVLGMMIPKLLETSSGMDQVKFASNAMGDAQGILGKVMDMTTGKINTQNGALIALARAQLLVARVQAQTRAAEARSAVADIQSRPLEFLGNGFGGGIGLQRRQVDARDTISQQVLSGAIDGNTAIQRLENLRKVGVLTDEQFSSAAASVANLGVELENLKVFDNATKLLNGESVPGGGGLLKTVKAASRKAGQEGGKDAADEWAKAFLEGTGKFDPEIQKRLQGIFAQTEADLLDIRTAQTDAFERNHKETKAAIEATQEWNTQLVRTATLFGQIGGAGAGIASVLNILAGNYGAVNGPLGAFAQSLAMLSWKDKDGNTLKLGEEFTKALDGVFGQDGRFFQALKGSELGAATGTLLFGNNSGAQIGGAIGGAIGSFLGPIGNVVGSVIGSGLGAAFKEIKPSLIGGIFGGILGAFGLGSAKYGTANLTGMGAAGIKGNAGTYKDNATDAASSIQDVLSNVADALGGTVGSFNVSIGQYKGKWRVSPGGMTGKLNKGDTVDFGKEGADAAIKFAIADAIKDGAIKGVGEAVGRLLAGGKDLDKQVQKAQLFQGVFAELKAETDPIGSALDGVAKQFDALRKIFDEAGASAEEFASLEQLLAIKRQDAADQARRSIVDKVRDPVEMGVRIVELLGKQEDALAASRLLEIAGLKGSLQPMQALIYQLEDARAVIETFQPLADDLKSFKRELIGVTSAQSLGAAGNRFRATALAAANGDAMAMGDLRGVATSFLDAAKANARSSLDYRRALGEVLSSVDKSIFAAEAKVDYAQAQLDAVKSNSAILEQMRQQLVSLQSQVVENTGYTARMWSRFEGDGMPVRSTEDSPLIVEISA